MKVSVIITDHNIRNLFDTTDRNYVIADGSIIAEGTSRELLRNTRLLRIILDQILIITNEIQKIFIEIKL